MPLPTLNLDDRQFDELVAVAIRRAQQSSPEWTDYSPGDPGVVLLELFAHLTEVMIYRLNRLPKKAYIEFLNLLGVTLQPPAAALADLEFTLEKAATGDVKIPRGTRVGAAVAGADPVIFITTEEATLAAGKALINIPALHCEQIDGEVAGFGNGLPGLSVNISRRPIIARCGDRNELIVGVEADAGTLDVSTPVREFQGKSFRIWREVDGFSDLRDESYAYVCDRMSGKIIFAPALRIRDRDGDGEITPQAVHLAAIPEDGKEIRVWYRSGGGSAGNLVADKLVQLKDALPLPFKVRNPKPSVGGRDAESIENALQRGPQELHSLRRAVTAQDYEMHALRSSKAINRAYAYTKHRLWKFAPRGTAEIIVVPDIDPKHIDKHRVTMQQLEERKNDAVLKTIGDALTRKAPLGTRCSVKYAHYKEVVIRASLTVFREEDKDAVRERVIERLNKTISPVRVDASQRGWNFGQRLGAYDVYRIIGSEPGVKNVEPVKLEVLAVPAKDVTALGLDAFQKNTWYAASETSVYRSVNDGAGWEQLTQFGDEQISMLKPFPKESAIDARRAGLLAAVTRPKSGKESRIYLSHDCGESFEAGLRTQFEILDFAWFEGEAGATLMLATEGGLYQLTTEPGATPAPILVDPANQAMGFYAVTVSSDVWGQVSVAVAAQDKGGVYLSTDGGKPGTFSNIGLKGEEIRVLASQHWGPNRALWAGVWVVGDKPGKGCCRFELSSTEKTSQGEWDWFSKGWAAGNCQSLAFRGDRVLAASRRDGVLIIDGKSNKAEWLPGDVNCGLPMQKKNRMHAVNHVAAQDDEDGGNIMVAGPEGIYISSDKGKSYSLSSRVTYNELVTLPETWLFCSGKHEITVEHENEAIRD